MREKLIELIGSTEYGNGSLIGNNFQKGFIKKIADHLIANGVTLDNQVSSSKWIPVSERLPKRNEKVLVCDTREDYVSIWENFEDGLWYGDDVIWATEDITHWMQLPEPPKED